MPPQEVFRRSFQTWNSWFPTLIFGVLGALSTYNHTWWQMDKMSDQFKASFYDTRDTFDFIIGKQKMLSYFRFYFKIINSYL